ncbi:endonuclease NucS domain-containing protein [Halomarina ordinaria]|uniref:Endonuclease NucS domain-containing protein n=1 Tax=Halomarina ordinaria TaxID=3033939 RepID=A0ABD5UCN8_9EURY|nr:endonuclease NucS domain-containing protein [Halomarina sp. PSRA2]
MSPSDPASTVRIVAGDCTTEFEGTREQVQRGCVVCLLKPDDTVLVHDADGYQPVAWLTRPESRSVTHDPLVVEARDGDQFLRVTVHESFADYTVPAGPAGAPVGTAPDGGALVRTRGAVVNLDSGARYGLPADAVVLDARCDCGLPRMRVERGAVFEVCVDRACESLDDAVREAFDRAWDCPDCGTDLRVLRRGGLLAGCDAYPDCETAFVIPEGVVSGTCPCGLPAFETPSGVRCLDATCDRPGGNTFAGP